MHVNEHRGAGNRLVKVMEKPPPPLGAPATTDPVSEVWNRDGEANTLHPHSKSLSQGRRVL